jgi:hypothetical protein
MIIYHTIRKKKSSRTQFCFGFILSNLVLTLATLGIYNLIIAHTHKHLLNKYMQRKTK